VDKANRLHYSILTIDTHQDTPMRLPSFNIGERHEFGTPGCGYVDLPRMKDGGLAAAIFAVFEDQGPRTPEGREKARASTLRTLNLLDTVFADHAALCAKALAAKDAERIFTTGKRAIFIGLENAYPLGTDVSGVDLFFQRGVRCITLVHRSDNDICDSGTDDKDPEDRGLSEFGTQVVRRMNELGMLVDLSHSSDKSFFDVLQATKAPVIASHSCVRALRNHPRNLSDAQLQALKKNGGVIQIAFVADFLKTIPPIPEREQELALVNRRIEDKGGWEALTPQQTEEFRTELLGIREKYPEASGSVKDVVDHIDYVVKAIGIGHVGIGTDFDGGGYLSDCRDVAGLPKITAELMRRGYSKKDIRKIWGGNFLRVLKKVETVASASSDCPEE
jgi:membrane dipeptidase